MCDNGWPHFSRETKKYKIRPAVSILGHHYVISLEPFHKDKFLKNGVVTSMNIQEISVTQKTGPILRGGLEEEKRYLNYPLG